MCIAVPADIVQEKGVLPSSQVSHASSALRDASGALHLQQLLVTHSLPPSVSPSTCCPVVSLLMVLNAALGQGSMLHLSESEAEGAL